MTLRQFQCSSLLLFLLGCSPVTLMSRSERQQTLQKLEKELASQVSTNLQSQIDTSLAQGLQQRRLDSQVNAAWQIMHAVICYGKDLQIDTPDRGTIGALDYVFSGGQLMGFELMAGNEILPSTGRVGLKARLEPGSYIGQGHVDQWLAIFAMADIPLETEIQLGDQKYTLLDWARQAQFDTSRNLLDEFSWTLIALAHYFPNEPTWEAADGHTLSWEDLVAVELSYEIDLSPCGGAHRLAGITRAIQAKNRLNLEDSPTWQQAQDVVDECLLGAKENRGADGSLSSRYFERPGRTADLSAVLASTGHVLEFVSLASAAKDLADPWVELAVVRLCETLLQTRHVELDCGGLYHALNGLKIYRARRFSSPAE